jgi:hypothetical protein
MHNESHDSTTPCFYITKAYYISERLLQWPKPEYNAYVSYSLQ